MRSSCVLCGDGVERETGKYRVHLVKRHKVTTDYIKCLLRKSRPRRKEAIPATENAWWDNTTDEGCFRNEQFAKIEVLASKQQILELESEEFAVACKCLWRCGRCPQNKELKWEDFIEHATVRHHVNTVFNLACKFGEKSVLVRKHKQCPGCRNSAPGRSLKRNKVIIHVLLNISQTKTQRPIKKILLPKPHVPQFSG